MSAHKLATSLPRASHFDHFMADPFEFLARERSVHGNLFVIREREPIFSRTLECAGVIAALGVDNQRAVLGDIESFGMPISAMHHLKLPENLINLNRSLHSMTGDQHAIQKRLLARLVNNCSVNAFHDLVLEAFEDVTKGWSAGTTFGLLSEMRALMFQVSSRVLFGKRYAENAKLASLLDTYFLLRREMSSPAQQANRQSLEQLVSVGNSVDSAMRAYVRECRQRRAPSGGGLLANLASLETEGERPFSEDAVVGHCNILFVSSTEPIAVSLTWILLILSQLPALRDQLRDELNSVLGTASHPAPEDLGQLLLLDHVIKESLRLLPPNAFMVRITRRQTSLNGTPLPAQCEVVICPFLAHRDGEVFQHPHDFIPGRWKNSAPSPYAYFPFGAGSHACIGANLATQIIKMTLAFLLPRYDLLLAGDVDLDWRLHILFMPMSDPPISIRPLNSDIRPQAGKLCGPLAKLLNLDTCSALTPAPP